MRRNKGNIKYKSQRRGQEAAGRFPSLGLFNKRLDETKAPRIDGGCNQTKIEHTEWSIDS